MAYCPECEAKIEWTMTWKRARPRLPDCGAALEVVNTSGRTGLSFEHEDEEEDACNEIPQFGREP